MAFSSSYVKYMALGKHDGSLEASISVTAGGPCEIGICPTEAVREQTGG